MSDPVLFLDFDGVLHPGGLQAFDCDGAFLDHPDFFCHLDYLTRLLAPHPEIKIIVSSDWRLHFSNLTLRGFLAPLGKDRYLGAVEAVRMSRANEIYAEVALRGIDRWLALDDHPSVQEAFEEDGEWRFVVCHPRHGISSQDTQQELREKLLLISQL